MSQTNLPKRLKAAGARAGARGRSNDLLAGARAERAKDRGRSGPVRSGNKAVRRGLNSSLAGRAAGAAQASGAAVDEFRSWWARNHPWDWWRRSLGRAVNTKVRIEVWAICRDAFYRNERRQGTASGPANKEI